MSDVEMIEVKTRICSVCGEGGTVMVPRAGWEARQNGQLIQIALPEVGIEEREQLISGIHPICWRRLFNPEHPSVARHEG